MKILISNDDGYNSEGIMTLSEELSKIAEIIVIAPECNKSGASSSLTLESPLRITKVDNERYFVNGTPADSVHLGLSDFLSEDPDIVVSGINHGANLGDDVFYSGTVGAAMQGRFLELPSIAVSLAVDEGRNFRSAAKIVELLIGKIQKNPLPSNIVLNVNVPDLPFDELNGIQVTRLGQRERSKVPPPAKDPYGRKIYWIGPAGGNRKSDYDTDFDAIARGMVSITPLKLDLTEHQLVEDMGEWLNS